MISNLQRQEICVAHSTMSLTQHGLANWAKAEFKLTKAPSQTTISRILGKRKEYEAMISVPELSAKRRRKIKYQDLDDSIANWVMDCESRNIPISHDLIKVKSLELANLMKISDPPKFSNGWMEKFVKRHGFLKFRTFGESGSVNMALLNAALPQLRTKIALFDPDNVYNMDESGLFYAKAPSSTVARKPVEGLKVDKRRITLAFAADATGSHKLPVFFIGKSKCPRCFNKKTAAALGFEYGYNRKAWMTSELFGIWIANFNKLIKKQNRKVLLLLDNAPTHKFVKLSNVEILFLPPNCTSKIQPMDSGIIAAFKKRYKKYHLLNAVKLANLKEVTLDIFNVNQLTAMQWCNKAWNDISSETIANCFGHSGLIAVGSSSELKRKEINLSIEKEVCMLLNLLNLENEEEDEAHDVHEPTADEFLVAPVIAPKVVKTQLLMTNFFNK